MLAQRHSGKENRLVVVGRDASRGRSLAAALRRAGYRVSVRTELPQEPADCPVLCSVPEEAHLEWLPEIASHTRGRAPLVVVDLPPALFAEALARGADEVVARTASDEEIAARVRCAADRYRSNGRSRLSRGELEALLEITEAATSHLELEELLRVVVTRIAGVVPADRCSAILLDNEEYATVMASHDVPELRRLRISVDRYPELRAAVETRAPVVIDDLHTHPLMAEVRPLVSSLPVSSLVVAPLVAQGDAYGALLLRLARRTVFGEDEKAFVQAAASAVANSVRNARLHTSVRQKRDELEAAYQQRYQELDRLNEQLREANRIKDELLAIVSHDVRSPLNTLLGHARLLLAANLPPQQHRSAQAVVRQGQRVLELVHQILESGKRGPVKQGNQPVDLAAVARALAEDTVGERRVRVVAMGDPSVVVEGDASALRQVLENLVSNAIQHSPEGEQVEVEVRLSPSADHARVEVRDRGPGIAPEQLALVFERYRRSEGSKGLGLGLAISRDIVEAHGGSIWATGRDGGGSCFVFTVPLRQTGTGGRRILAIAPDAEQAQRVVEILRDDTVVVSHSLKEGIQQAALILPDAILVDATISNAAVALRAEPGIGEVPLIFLGDAPDEVRSLPLPIDGDRLRALLEEAVRR